MLRSAKQGQINVVFATFVAPGLEREPRGPHSCVDEIVSCSGLEQPMTAKTWNTSTAGAHNAKDFDDSAARLRRLRRLSGIARMMDTAIGIPGTRLRFGADSVLGLVPLVGDGAGALVGLYIVNEARRLGIPPEKLARMVGNVAMDSVVGSVPLLGDIFDLYFKSHRRNVDMIFDHFGVDRDDVQRKR